MRHIEIVHHSACDGYEAMTEAWVADEMTGAELDSALADVRGSYLAHLRQLPAQLAPEPVARYGADWSNHRERNVGEVLDEQERLRTERREWERARAALAKRFSDFLFADPRFSRDDPDATEVTIDWGHLHGGLPIKF